MSSLSVEQQARIAVETFDRAAETCAHSLLEWDCTTYHGLWQLLRLSGVQPSIDRDADHINACLSSALLCRPDARVLITGCADYGLLALLLALDSEHTLNLQIDILDTCDTPLAANRRYAARCGATITTHQVRLFDFVAEQHYDLVITHSFISQFPLIERPQLMAHWYHLLKPDGHLITTVRTFADSNDITRSKFESKNARDKVQALVRGLDTQGVTVPVSARELETLLLHFIRERPTLEVTTASHLDKLLVDAGFEVVQWLTKEAKKPGEDSLMSVPRQSSGAKVVTLRAVKAAGNP